jgi:hypothetical protein
MAGSMTDLTSPSAVRQLPSKIVPSHRCWSRTVMSVPIFDLCHWTQRTEPDPAHATAGPVAERSATSWANRSAAAVPDQDEVVEILFLDLLDDSDGDVGE